MKIVRFVTWFWMGTLFLSGIPSYAQVSDLEIDVNETREEISPFIYGQFIEHLGRCIYDGMWAEMLADRKFFHPIDGRTPVWTLHEPGEPSWEGEGQPYELMTRSPWLVIGDLSGVTIVRENSFVGEHSPQVQFASEERRGIYQDGLALERDRDYVGRIVLAAVEQPVSPVEVTLVWGHGAEDRVVRTFQDLSSEYETREFSFRAGKDTDSGKLEVTGRGGGAISIGAVSLMPADNIAGWRADTVALLKELDAPIYRWPGGNFVSGYNWRDGIGDRDQRPPRKNPAWTGIESNDVGLHEFIELCREIDTEPFIAINTGLGDAESAAEEVEYVNGSLRTEQGRLRAGNGHPAPFQVRWWAVGNEMYGDWQLGHMPLEDYVEKHKEVADAIWAVDPTARLVGVGAVGEWSRTMLEDAAGHMNLISEHLYWQDEDDLVEHVRQIPAQIKSVAEAHRRYRNDLGMSREEAIPIAMDEWNYWYGPFEYGELGVRYHLQDALGIAAGLHEFFRNSDIYFMANYAQTVNVIGAIKTTPTEVAFATTGLVLKLYRERFGSTPVTVSGSHEPLDIAAAWKGDRSGLTLAVVNPTSDERVLQPAISGMRLTGPTRKWTITGLDRYSYNEPGKPPEVSIDQVSFQREDREPLVIPPLSVTLFWLDGYAAGD